MNKISRNIGMCLYSIMEEMKISIEELAEKIGLSLRDTRRMIEGRLYLSPIDIEMISSKLDRTSEEFISFVPDRNFLVPDLEFNKEFSSEDNLYRIIDLIDEYIELKEQM